MAEHDVWRWQAVPHRASDTGGEEAAGKSAADDDDENYYRADEGDNHEEELGGGSSEGEVACEYLFGSSGRATIPLTWNQILFIAFYIRHYGQYLLTVTEKQNK